MSNNNPLVSVIIPCYNQAHFLAEAIESTLNQDYANVEVIVINDGSTDCTKEVATQFEVIYIEQENQGRASARNQGVYKSRGEYLVFLDSDDRLLPCAIDRGVQCISKHSECGFVYGQYRLVKADGGACPFWQQICVPSSYQQPEQVIRQLSVLITRLLIGAPFIATKSDPFESLLRWNHIAMLSTVLFQRSVLESVGLFNPELSACEDYELYLRIVRAYPISSYRHIVSEYRLHDANTIRNRSRMLASANTVLEQQLPFVTGIKRLERAYQRGEKFWHYHYSRPTHQEILSWLIPKFHRTNT